MTARILAVVLVLLAARDAWAHKPSDAHLRLAVHGAVVGGRFDLAVRDLDNALVVDTDGNGDVTWGELQAARPRITAYVQSRLAVNTPGGACPLAFGAASTTQLSDGAYLSLALHATCPAEVAHLSFRYSLFFDVDAQHRGLIVLPNRTLVVRDGGALEVDVPVGPSWSARVRDALWAGLDTLLALLVLLAPVVGPGRARSRSGAKGEMPRGAIAVEAGEIVVAFLLAHAITLILSSAAIVRVPHVVGGMMALALALAAANNLLQITDARWAIGFALGLVLGFDPTSHVLLVPQLMVSAAVLALVYLTRRTLASLVLIYAGSATVGVLALLWTFERWTS